MDKFKFVVTDGELKADDKKVMVQGLLSHHANSGHPRKSESFNVTLKNERDALVGVAVATVLWNGLEINSLWVKESERDKGWGRKLMEIVEEEGIKRGATISYTNTFTWQAPSFYEKLGYEVYGKLDNFPKGSALNYYFKKL